MSDKKAGFTPMEIPKVCPGRPEVNKLTCTTTIRGEAAKEFEALCDKYDINKSQLLTQMVYHCLNRSDDLRDFYRRVAILGK